MNFLQCSVRDAWLVVPSPHVDERGHFMRVWCEDEFIGHGIQFRPRQANMGLSRHRGTVRGLHYQLAPALEAKLVRCTRGSLFDVVVDLRAESPTFGSWHGAYLTAGNGHMLLIPEGCAHGCQALEDDTEFHYMASERYSPEHARGVRHDDPAIGVAWPQPVTVVSDQDRRWPLLDFAAGRQDGESP